jgi:hypothetical protein
VTVLKNPIKINPLTKDARFDERRELQKISEKQFIDLLQENTVF